MKSKGPDKEAQRAAARAQEEANRIQQEALLSQENMRLSFQQNEDAQNLAAIIPGGTASELEGDVTPGRRRRRQRNTGLASSVGITV